MNIPISSFENFKPQVPPGDNVERMVCGECEWIHYENPRVILSALCLLDNQILLCRRAIPPRYGFWTLPGGFMEIGETMEEGVCREVREEAGAVVKVQSLLGAYVIPRIGQVHMVYLAEMATPEFAAGVESLDVRMFPVREDRLPWEELAFPVNRWALRDYLSLDGGAVTRPFTTRPEFRDERMSSVRYHPGFPPPDAT